MLEIIYQSVVAVIHFGVLCVHMFGGTGTVVSPRDNSRTNKPFNNIGQSRGWSGETAVNNSCHESIRNKRS